MLKKGFIHLFEIWKHTKFDFYETQVTGLQGLNLRDLYFAIWSCNEVWDKLKPHLKQTLHFSIL